MYSTQQNSLWVSQCKTQLLAKLFACGYLTRSVKLTYTTMKECVKPIGYKKLWGSRKPKSIV